MIWGGGGKIENGFIFSAGMPLEIYFLFFPWEGPPRFFFSISSGPPQIINGRPLTDIPSHLATNADAIHGR